MKNTGAGMASLVCREGGGGGLVIGYVGVVCYCVLQVRCLWKGREGTRGGWTRSRAHKKWACFPIYNTVQNVSHDLKP